MIDDVCDVDVVDLFIFVTIVKGKGKERKVTPANTTWNRLCLKCKSVQIININVNFNIIYFNT